MNNNNGNVDNYLIKTTTTTTFKARSVAPKIKSIIRTLKLIIFRTVPTISVYTL